MNNIIFLDIDGVLTSEQNDINNHEYYINMYKVLNETNYSKILKDELILKLIDIDMEKVYMLRDVCKLTNAKIVITSTWKGNRLYPLIEEQLISRGLPIIDVTTYIDNRRGEEIRAFLRKNKVDNYVILDDDIFEDYNELICDLIRTTYYNGEGLTEDNCEEIVKRLKK